MGLSESENDVQLFGNYVVHVLLLLLFHSGNKVIDRVNSKGIESIFFDSDKGSKPKFISPSSSTSDLTIPNNDKVHAVHRIGSYTSLVSLTETQEHLDNEESISKEVISNNNPSQEFIHLSLEESLSNGHQEEFESESMDDTLNETKNPLHGNKMSSWKHKSKPKYRKINLKLNSRARSVVNKAKNVGQHGINQAKIAGV